MINSIYKKKNTFVIFDAFNYQRRQKCIANNKRSLCTHVYVHKSNVLFMREIAVRFKPGDFKLQVEEVTLHQSKITSSLILLYYWKQLSKSHSYRTTKNQDSRLLIKNLIFILSFAKKLFPRKHNRIIYTSFSSTFP